MIISLILYLKIYANSPDRDQTDPELFAVFTYFVNVKQKF